MKVAQINGGVFGSTGRIMFGIADALRAAGHEALCFSPVTTTNKNREPDHDYIKIGGFFTRRLDVLSDMITGSCGGAAVFATKKLINELKRFDPDVIHLHVIHGGYVNIGMLFGYIGKSGKKLVWTMHDCWAFTGHCCHYDMIGCGKWKSGCENCPLYREYPKNLFDSSRKQYEKKKRLFTGIDDMTIVTPSRWLKEQISGSFLKNVDTTVINNGIDTDVFRPTASDFKSRIGCADKHIAAGAAFGWDDKKGLDVFKKLANTLPDDIRIVLVGTSASVEAGLPGNIIPIRRTQSKTELAEIYSAADVFVNPTREDTFPTVNMEALACGTPVVTFDTGGSSEIADGTCGAAVPKDDVDALEREIIRICRDKPFTEEACLRRSELYNAKEKFEEYLRLY